MTHPTLVSARGARRAAPWCGLAQQGAPWLAIWLAALVITPDARASNAEPALTLSACRLKGVSHEARCGVLPRPLDPAQPAGTTIDIHVAVLPALARNKKPDPVFFFAGGPGQSAIELAPQIQTLLGRFGNRRDVVLIDQRGTGRSAPLRCEDESPTRSLRESTDPRSQMGQLRHCLTQLEKLPYGDLRHFTTTIAMADVEAVRQALGQGPVNVMGGSYGTRAVLEYLRLYPASVRRAVLDGVAPPDMALPVAFSTDGQRALDALLADCEAQPACRAAYPQLRPQWQALLASLPREVTVAHPMTGREEKLTVTRDMLTSLVRLPLYMPMLSSALPLAIQEASAGRFSPLLALTTGLSSGSKGLGLAAGMHFSVVCAEDMPRVAQSTDQPGADFGDASLRMYRSICELWPRGTVPADFYRIPATPAPTLLLSGSLDPVTPPRHADRVAQALGAQALSLTLPNLGHGVMGQAACMRDVVFRFIDDESPTAALAQAKSGAACAAQVPRPPAFRPLQDAPADLSATPARSAMLPATGAAR